LASIVLATCRTKPGLTPGDTLLATALERAGASVTAAPWDALDPADTDGAIVCLRSTWDYHLRWDEFRRWIARFTGHGRLWNPAATVLWNADKRYLRDLAEAGIALPRTRWFEAGERPDTDAVLAEWGLERGVLKPRVSATAFGTHLIERGQRLPEAEWRPLENAGCLLQAFVAEIAARGEVSLMYLDGVYSHAVLKRPASGDFRVQTDFGGRLERAVPSASVRAFGDAVLAAVTQPWLYARVDLVDSDRGPVLMELELIEPDLFLDPGSAERMAAALLARANRAAA
jgi:glutathione synthase/RimK-type ligase-like ATP-grasp enzyme